MCQQTKTGSEYYTDLYMTDVSDISHFSGNILVYVHPSERKNLRTPGAFVGCLEPGNTEDSNTNERIILKKHTKEDEKIKGYQFPLIFFEGKNWFCMRKAI